MLHNYLLGPDELSPSELAGIVTPVIAVVVPVITTVTILAVKFCYKKRKGMPDYNLMSVYTNFMQK